jgi:hypothetical protein
MGQNGTPYREVRGEAYEGGNFGRRKKSCPIASFFFD